MKHANYKPDLADWQLEAIDELHEIVEGFAIKAAAEACHLAMQDKDTYLYMPVEYSVEDDGAAGCDGIEGAPVADPLTVYVRLALRPNDGSELPTYGYSLRDALKGSMDECAREGAFSAGLGRLSKALREFADDIDAARAAGEVAKAKM